MSDKVWFDPDVLWDVALEFQDWGYQCNASPPPGPTYPRWWLEEASHRKLGFPGTSLDAYLKKSAKLTNCCMFSEALLIGALMRQRPASPGPWTSTTGTMWPRRSDTRTPYNAR